MIEIPIIDAAGKQVGSEKLDPDLLGGRVRYSLLKQAIVNLSKTGSGAYLGRPGVLVTLRGVPTDLFTGQVANPLPKSVKTGFSALLLLVAYNMISPHVGSEVL